jgi:hypothetical protein
MIFEMQGLNHTNKSGIQEQEKKQGMRSFYTLLPVPFRLRIVIPIHFPVVS